MGNIFSKPKMPEKSQEQIAAEKAEEERLARVEKENEERKLEAEKKATSNLVGRRSLQAAGMEGYTGFRRKQMGAAQPTQAGGGSMGTSVTGI